MRLKSTTFALALAIAALTAGGIASAQSFSLNWNPRTGDVWVDTQLQDVNRYGSRYQEPFVNEMVRYYGAPRDLVHDLLVNRNWAPGDVYYACAIAQVIGRPCRQVVDEWERDHGQGWGEIAKRMGIKPGSPEFHRLKRGFVPTYDRWARPIRIDDDLARDFPGRGQAKQARGEGPGNSGNAGNRGRAAEGGRGNADGRGKSDQKGKGKDKERGGKGSGNGNGKG